MCPTLIGRLKSQYFGGHFILSSTGMERYVYMDMKIFDNFDIWFRFVSFGICVCIAMGRNLRAVMHLLHTVQL